MTTSYIVFLIYFFAQSSFQVEIENSFESAEKLFFAGLGGMCQITDADLVKKKF